MTRDARKPRTAPRELGAKLHVGRRVFCVGKHGMEGIGGWGLLTGIDIGWVAVFVLFSGVEIVTRARSSA